VGAEKMKVIQTRVDVGADRVLRVPLPDDMPTGPLSILLIIDDEEKQPSQEERRAAAEQGQGALREFDISTEEFLRERREDDARRDRALGL
jgi:hypothetical protein